MTAVAFFFSALGIWIGLMPYMLLRYRNCDLFGNGRYVKENEDVRSG
jgi:hypothetical protein